jgi:hypothetical protein
MDGFECKQSMIAKEVEKIQAFDCKYVEKLEKRKAVVIRRRVFYTSSN